jgi:hypothetical protein
MLDASTQDTDLRARSTNLVDLMLLVDQQYPCTLQVHPEDWQADESAFGYRQQNQLAAYNEPVVRLKIALEHLYYRYALLLYTANLLFLLQR